LYIERRSSAYTNPRSSSSLEEQDRCSRELSVHYRPSYGFASFDGDSELIVDNLVSSGYLDLTIEICAEFGVEIKRNANGAGFWIPGNQVYKATDLIIEGDWSAGAFLAVGAAIAGSEEGLEIHGLHQDSTQPDRAIVDVLTEAGAQVQFKGSDCIVRASALAPFDFDATNCPDLFPPPRSHGSCHSGQVLYQRDKAAFIQRKQSLSSIVQDISEARCRCNIAERCDVHSRWIYSWSYC